ncbi:histone-lysine N-methyltransferase PRDM7-like [Cydia fagiglandana]|uniref:histone-lysine N-methyltransferase PRDM7-like n=1 Tax=Cydia fagiglandana TaxID=1458189 RepID=UPI002FEE29CA
MSRAKLCSSCGDYVYEYCSIHGRLLVIPDDEVPPPPGPPAPRAALPLPRAALSLPRAFLHLAPSTIPGAGIGVFSTLTLPTGVRFGPYRGLKTQAVTSAYCWQIFDGERKPSHVLDARDANKSNWMRYVNCSRHFSEQNLVAFQYQGQLYYRTIKIIPRFTELLVFYGSEFASQLRVDLRRYHAPCTHTLVKCEAENEEDTKIPEEKLVTETAVDNKENVIQTRYPLEVEQIYDDSKHSSEGDFLGFRLNEWKNVNVVQKPDPLEEDIYDEIEEREKKE